MLKRFGVSMLAALAALSAAHADDTTDKTSIQTTTNEQGTTRETITRFSEDKGTFIPLYVNPYRGIIPMPGATLNQHCSAEASIRADLYRKQGAVIDVVDKTDYSAFYIATLGRTAHLKERVFLVYCDPLGALVVGLRVDPNVGEELRPVEQFVRETTSGSSSSSDTNSSGSGQKPSVNININQGGGGQNGN